MDEAVERYTDKLKKIEQEKKTQLDDFKWRVEAEKDLVANEKRIK